MISQRTKDLYFILMYPIAKLNYYRYRFLNSFIKNDAPSSLIWLNIGSGRHYLKRCVNIEGNIFQKKDMWLDIRAGLPYSDNTVDAIYATYLFEHFYMSELSVILSECRRVLKSESIIRIVVPDFEKAVSAYINKKNEWFVDFPAKYNSLSGRLFNFLMCDGQHKLIFDFSFMKEVLEKTGFKNVVKMAPAESKVFPQEFLNTIENDTSLVVESIK